MINIHVLIWFLSVRCSVRLLSQPYVPILYLFEPYRRIELRLTPSKALLNKEVRVVIIVFFLFYLTFNASKAGSDVIYYFPWEISIEIYSHVKRCFYELQIICRSVNAIYGISHKADKIVDVFCFHIFLMLETPSEEGVLVTN